MAAEVEEVVVSSDAFKVQDGLPEVGEGFFEVALWGDVVLALPGAAFGCG